MPKKTCQLIIDSGNDYLIAVKGNQPQLSQQVQFNTQSAIPTSVDTRVEKTRNRITIRTVSVFDNLSNICPDWMGLKSLIKVERRGWRGGHHYSQIAY